MPLNTTPARKGRERFCALCGAIYRSLRSNSLYCSNACRLKGGRGRAPKGGPKAGPAGFSPITKALYLTGYVGRVGPASSHDTGPHVYALLVDPNEAYAELAYQFDRKGWGIVSRDEFDDALKSDGINAFSTRSPQSLERNRWLARQSARMRRTI